MSRGESLFELLMPDHMKLYTNNPSFSSGYSAGFSSTKGHNDHQYNHNIHSTGSSSSGSGSSGSTVGGSDTFSVLTEVASNVAEGIMNTNPSKVANAIHQIASDAGIIYNDYTYNPGHYNQPRAMNNEL